MLPLTFADPADYDKVCGEGMLLDIVNLPPKPGERLRVIARDAATGETMHEIAVDHTFNDEQIEWFGSFGRRLDEVCEEEIVEEEWDAEKWKLPPMPTFEDVPSFEIEAA